MPEIGDLLDPAVIAELQALRQREALTGLHVVAKATVDDEGR